MAVEFTMCWSCLFLFKILPHKSAAGDKRYVRYAPVVPLLTLWSATEEVHSSLCSPVPDCLTVRHTRRTNETQGVADDAPAVPSGS